jgi:A/G-specific adenine glycosylase
MIVQNLPGDVIASIRAELFRFFAESARDLPWRRTTDPYAILVSEVMLQQTRVEAVIPYYERWLSRFPDVDTLACASIDDVLKSWEGLGYYSRARNLHSAALVLRERHSGAVPVSYDALRELPGVGEYTAGAVASIAYSHVVPAVDGNVRRVLARLLEHPDPPPSLLRSVAASLVPAERPGDFNQALMELGATICTPRAPRCARCPVSSWCAAYAAGTQLERPAVKQRAAVPSIRVATAVIRRPDGRLFVVRRPDTGLLAGMWNFPGVEITDGADAAAAALRVTSSFGFTVSSAVELCSITHLFSHRRERYECLLVDVSRAGSRKPRTAWIGARTQYALPRAQQRILARALSVEALT